MVANHSSKIKKLELERMDYQKKIIEAERDKRDFTEKLEQERQATYQTMQRFDQQKQEYDRLQAESTQIGGIDSFQLRAILTFSKYAIQHD